MVLATGYKIGRRLDIGSGGYIFDFVDNKIHECIDSIFREETIDCSYKIFKVEVNVDNEIEVLEIISNQKLVSEYLESYNLNLLDFILNALDVNKEHIRALVVR